MQGKPKHYHFSRPSLLMLAILCYKWDGSLTSVKGTARKYLTEELWSLFPDLYGARGGSTLRHDKDSVLRKMRDKGLIVLSPPIGGITRAITITSAGSRYLRKGLADQRYHDELQLVRDYYGGGEEPEWEPAWTPAPISSQQSTSIELPVEFVKALEEEAIAEVVAPEEEIQPEIAIAPSWDYEPAEERVGWALLSGGEDWLVVNDDMVALTDAITGLKEVRAIYPLTVANALPPKG